MSDKKTGWEDQVVTLPAWLVVRMFSAMRHASGYCEGMGKPCEFLIGELEVLEEKVFTALGEQQ
jgi:hypothetical protein